MDPIISGPMERLGTVSVLAVAAYFLVKYFMAEMAKKDTRNMEITDRFITAMTKQTEVVTKVIVDNTTAMLDLKDAVRQLTSPIRGPRASDTVGQHVS